MSRTALALTLGLALAGSGCNWFRKKQPPPPPPPPPPQVVTPQTQPAPPKPAPQKVKPAPEPATPPPAPALGQILTNEQRAQYKREFDASLQVAQQALARVAGQPLSRDQAESANRIRSFVTQARETASRDPQAAAQLARRAEVLARDLLNSIR